MKCTSNKIKFDSSFSFYNSQFNQFFCVMMCQMFRTLVFYALCSSVAHTKTDDDSFTCSSDSDCSYLGVCDTSSNECKCFDGWYGDNCGYLNVNSTFDNNFYSTNGYHNTNGLSSWDGSVVYDSQESKWHLYNTILSNGCGVDAFLSNSYIVHLVSNSSDIMGPYIVKDIPLTVYNDSNSVSKYWDALSVFNPFIITNTNNNNNNTSDNITDNNNEMKYYLFYTGTSDHNATHNDCGNHNNKTRLRNNQRIGAAYSNSLYGPWKRFSNNPIIDVIKNENINNWDSLFTTNPNPYILANGTLMVVYKGRSIVNPNAMHTGYAIVNGNNWNDTYFRYNYSFDVSSNCEDGFFWQINFSSVSHFNSNSNNSYHMIYHCQCNTLHGYSNDLIKWQYNKQQPWCDIKLINGTKITLKRRERPFIVFSNNDKSIQTSATTIFTAVEPPQGHTFNLVQSL